MAAAASAAGTSADVFKKWRHHESLPAWGAYYRDGPQVRHGRNTECREREPLSQTDKAAVDE
jgi:hypothetical protein